MFIFCLLMLPFASATKVLCLHGGGSSAVQFRAQMKQVMADTPELDYVFADGGNWFRDPPGGKMEPTQDPDWDKASIELVKDLVVNQGPFDVVLGFSQGSAFIPAYLSITKGIFESSSAQRVLIHASRRTETYPGRCPVLPARACLPGKG